MAVISLSDIQLYETELEQDHIPAPFASEYQVEIPQTVDPRLHSMEIDIQSIKHKLREIMT